MANTENIPAGTVKIVFYAKADICDRIDQLARERGTSRSKILRAAIEREIEQPQEQGRMVG